MMGSTNFTSSWIHPVVPKSKWNMASRRHWRKNKHILCNFCWVSTWMLHGVGSSVASLAWERSGLTFPVRADTPRLCRVLCAQCRGIKFMFTLQNQLGSFLFLVPETISNKDGVPWRVSKSCLEIIWTLWALSVRGGARTCLAIQFDLLRLSMSFGNFDLHMWQTYSM